MQARPIVVTHSVGVTVVCFGVVTRKDLGTGAASESVSKAAFTVVRVGSRIAACACRRRSARIARTIVDIYTSITIASVARWARVAGEAGGWGGLVVAVHLRMVEAWAVHTAVRIRA